MTHAPRRRRLLARLAAYQAERFPLAGFVPLIAAFTFSSVAYSRLARGAPDFIPWPRAVLGAATMLVCFFVLRVLDEHKDADIDRRYRPELPVPRGLVTLGELRAVSGVALIAVVAIHAAWAPELLMPLGLAALWAALMTREFFVPDWLREHPTAYLLTHMAIMPLLDAYTTGLDWLAEGVGPPPGLALFLAVTFLNGMVIEIGRKIRAPETEREGVDTYTRAWGVRMAPAVWMALATLAAVLAAIALRRIGGGTIAGVVLAVGWSGCIVAAVRFLRRRDRAGEEAVEATSRFWPLASYLALGTLPFLLRLWQR